MGRIVVGVDGSAGAAAGLRWAAREGAARGWSVTAVLAWDLLGQHYGPAQEGFDPAYGEAEARAALDGYVDDALSGDRYEWADRLVERQVVCDLPAAGLLTAASDADLLVVGARGLGGFRGLLLGSVSEKCLHQSTCPVVVVRSPDGDDDGDWAGQIRRVVVGVDGSPASLVALGWALDEGRVHGAGVEVVRAWTLPLLAGEAFAGVAPEAAPFEADARRSLDEALAGVDTVGLTEPVQRTVVNDGPAAALLRAAESADLVVVGSRGRGGLTGLLLGSVSRQVAHHAPCSVLVVPPGAAGAPGVLRDPPPG